MAQDNILTCLPNYQLRAWGDAILRVADDLENFLKDENEVPKSIWDDIAEMRRGGQYLSRATSVTIPVTGINATNGGTVG